MGRYEPKGTITALVTPFNEDLSIDFPAFEKLIDLQIISGCDAIVVAGSTGESATLSVKEKLSLIIHAVEYSAGRIPIIAGTGSNDTQATIEMSLLAKEHGADAVLLVAPYYIKPSQEGLFHHYMAVSEQVDVPQIIYNVPSRSCCNILPETQLRIAEECANVVATKEASGDLEQMMQVIKYAPKGFGLLCGDDALTVPAVLMGAKGIISVLSNYAPKMFSECVNFALEGNYSSALELHYKLFDLMQLNFIESNPVPCKTALAIMGYIKEIVRMPLLPMQPANRKALQKALKKAKLIN